MNTMRLNISQYVGLQCVSIPLIYSLGDKTASIYSGAYPKVRQNLDNNVRGAAVITLNSRMFPSRPCVPQS